MSSRLVSNSSTELVKIKNRLSDTESKSRLDLNDNIDTFRGVVFTADSANSSFDSEYRAFLGTTGKKYKVIEFRPKEAILNERNDPEELTDGSKGNYYQVYVYFEDIDPPSWDPRQFDELSANYWGKVKKLHKALVPKKINGQNTKPSNETEWKFKFLKGGPKRNEWYSGVALYQEPARQNTRQFNYEGGGNNRSNSRSNSRSGGRSYGQNRGYRSSDNFRSVVTPSFMDEPPTNQRISHWVCNGDRMEWKPGARYDTTSGQQQRRDSAVHLQNLSTFRTLGTSQQGRGRGSSKFLTYEEVKNSQQWFDIERYRESVVLKESNCCGGYAASNKYGFMGAYQLGYEALRTHGFLEMDDATYDSIDLNNAWRADDGNRLSKRKFQEMLLAADWDDPTMIARWGPSQAAYYKVLSEQDAIATTERRKAEIRHDAQETFLSNKTTQDNIWTTYTMSRLQSLETNGIGDFSDPAELQGLLGGAHLKGLGDLTYKDLNDETGAGVVRGSSRRKTDGIWAFLQGKSGGQDAFNADLAEYYYHMQKGYYNKHSNPCADPNDGGNQ